MVSILKQRAFLPGCSAGAGKALKGPCLSKNARVPRVGRILGRGPVFRRRQPRHPAPHVRDALTSVQRGPARVWRGARLGTVLRRDVGSARLRTNGPAVGRTDGPAAGRTDGPASGRGRPASGRVSRGCSHAEPCGCPARGLKSVAGLRGVDVGRGGHAPFVGRSGTVHTHNT